MAFKQDWVSSLHLGSLFSIQQPVSQVAKPKARTRPRRFGKKDVEMPPDGPNYIACLPPELLAYIFWISLPDQHLPSQIPFEVALSHVCGFWRGTALNTPNLWTKIQIYSPRSSDLLSQYLRRSGSELPLDICIDTYDYEKSTRSVSHKRITLTDTISMQLSQQMYRIRKLSFFCYFKATPTLMLSRLLQSSALCLQHFIVKHDDPSPLTNSRTPPSTQLSLFEGGAPRLAFLSTNLPDILPSTTSLRNLTTLHLYSLNALSQHTYTSFVEVLKASLSLQYLSIQGRIKLDSWPMHSGGPNFELSGLKALRILDDGMMAVRLLLSMSAPNMESLWLLVHTKDLIPFLDSPQMQTAVGQNKFRSLQYLTLVNDNFRLLGSFAKAFPTVTHFHVPHPSFWHLNDLPQTLKTKWTLLHTLVFSMARDAKLENLYTVLDDVFTHRRRNGHPIQKLLVDKDFFDMVARNAPKIIKQVDVQVISSHTYREIWWNKIDRLEIDL